MFRAALFSILSTWFRGACRSRKKANKPNRVDGLTGTPVHFYYATARMNDPRRRDTGGLQKTGRQLQLPTGVGLPDETECPKDMAQVIYILRHSLSLKQ